jgi:hypothetical protein
MLQRHLTKTHRLIHQIFDSIDAIQKHLPDDDHLHHLDAFPLLNVLQQHRHNNATQVSPTSETSLLSSPQPVSSTTLPYQHQPSSSSRRSSKTAIGTVHVGKQLSSVSLTLDAVSANTSTASLLHPPVSDTLKRLASQYQPPDQPDDSSS